MLHQCLEGNPQCAAPPAFPSHSFDLLRARILDRSTLSSMSLMVSWPPALNSTRNLSSATMRAGHGGELIRNPGALFSGMPEPPKCRHARSEIYMAYWFPDRSCLISPVNTPHSKQTSTKSLHFALFPPFPDSRFEGKYRAFDFKATMTFPLSRPWRWSVGSIYVIQAHQSS